MPKLSIIVPVYGVEKYLNRCVESLINQTLKDIEIIMVDDKSPDNCPQMCDEYALMDNRIKVIHKEKNEGLGFARNTGLNAASGDYIAFVDSDDYVEPETYQTALDESLLNNLDICFFRHRRVDEAGYMYNEINDTNTYELYSKKDSLTVLKNMMGGSIIENPTFQIAVMVWSGIYRHTLLKKAGVFFKSEREIVSEDLIFHLDLLPNVERIKILPNVFYNYFVNTRSLSTSYNYKKFCKINDLLIVLKERLPNVYPVDTYNNIFAKYVLTMYKVIIRYESWQNTSLISKCKRIKTLCKMNILDSIYSISLFKIRPTTDRIIVFCLKYRISLFFIFLYNVLYHIKK